MPYVKPTLTALISSVKADLFSRFPTLDPSLTNSFATNLAEVIAAGNNGLYGYLDWIAQQPFPDTCDAEFVDRWASIVNLSRRAAAKAEGTATFTGGVGASVATGTLLIASNGEQYEVVTGFTLAASSEDHTVRAVDVGADGNLGAAAVLTFVSVPAGMGNTATVDGDGLTGGLDIETDDGLRARLLERFASPPKGGKALDYIAWAKEATSVTRAWVFTEDEPGLETVAVGEVLLYIAMDDDYSDGIPAAGDVTDVQDYIDAVRPVGASFTAAAPVALPVDFEVSITPDTPANRTATETELAEMVRSVGGVGSSIKLFDVYEAMAIVPNLTDWEVIDPVAAVATAAGELHTMGTVTFS
jgi:uncharacterized phage protein gp47/JayE